MLLSMLMNFIFGTSDEDDDVVDDDDDDEVDESYDIYEHVNLYGIDLLCWFIIFWIS